MKIKKCRNCKNNKLTNLFTLGKLSFTGKFPKNKNTNIKKTKLTLAMCTKCTLVQLDTSYDLKYLYGPDYGYRTGINKTMRDHMEEVKTILLKKLKLKKGDFILDIASNDGTLLNFFNKNLRRVGIDPLINEYKKFYKNINYKIPDFFSAKKILKKTPNKKFKIITALSVFYDISDPNFFFKDINILLDDDGILLLEHADLISIIKFKMFDTICQEHLAYYSNKVIIDMVKKNNLRVFDVKTNNINGGSTQYFICKKDSLHKTKSKLKSSILKKKKKNETWKQKNFF